MMSAMYASSDQNEFSQVYLSIMVAFGQLCTLSFDGDAQRVHIATGSLEYISGVLSALADERGRFRVWAENVGAHRTGKASLYHRLRGAPHIRSYVYELLQNLQQLLTEGTIQFWLNYILHHEVGTDLRQNLWI